MEDVPQSTGGASAALLLLGLLLIFMGFAVPLLLLVGIFLAFVGIVIHVLTPHHTHVAGSVPDAAAHPCPGCGTSMTWVDEVKRWYCAKEQSYR